MNRGTAVVPYADRQEAGQYLASKLSEYKRRDDVVVLALPRGGVPVAWPVAQDLDAPLDVFLVRKLGAPGQEELAMGAIADGGERVLNQEVVRTLGVAEADIEAVALREREELERRGKLYRGDRGPLEVQGKTCLLVDDGLATGASMLVALRGLKARGPESVVVAVPVAPPETCEGLASEADRVICAVTPEPFSAVGQWYRDFSQTTDDEVREIMKQAVQRGTSAK